MTLSLKQVITGAVMRTKAQLGASDYDEVISLAMKMLRAEGYLHGEELTVQEWLSANSATRQRALQVTERALLVLTQQAVGANWWQLDQDFLIDPGEAVSAPFDQVRQALDARAIAGIEQAIRELVGTAIVRHLEEMEQRANPSAHFRASDDPTL